jgi:N4-(beta-N-acetylglucosaminyl)-L-asparaginase
MHGFKEENLLTERGAQDLAATGSRSTARSTTMCSHKRTASSARSTSARPARSTSVRQREGRHRRLHETSGLAFKIPGRVGDSPLIGCGNYVDNDVGVAGSTGRGEAVILSNGASSVVHYMAQGMTPTDACLEAARRSCA